MTPKGSLCNIGEMKFQAIRGMNDIGPNEINQWHFLENTIRELYQSFCFQEIRTPLLEPAALFHRGVGEVTDIVEKEMYSFSDRNGEQLALRPEGTASIARALIEHNWLHDNPVIKAYYFGPMFRHERPQKGRYRQHYQFGLEIFGVDNPRADAEIISVHHQLFEKLKITDLQLHLSSIGCGECRPPFRKLLGEKLTAHRSEFCSDCQRRMERNPLRIFDCKEERCKKISSDMPTQFDFLCQGCRDHFTGLTDQLGLLKIPFQINPRIVRGLDYYTRTVFEFVSLRIGAQGTVCGGGRYDGLIELLGGRATAAVGSGMGLERLLLLLGDQLKELKMRCDLVIVWADAAGEQVARPLVYQLRKAGFHVELDLLERSLKAQMKRADKLQASRVGIIGQTEVSNQTIVLKDMSSGQQQTLALADLEKFLATSNQEKE